MQTATHPLACAIRRLLLVLATAIAGCGGTSGADGSPIPSTGVPEAAIAARGVTIADQGAPPPPGYGEDLDPFGTDPGTPPWIPQHPVVPPSPTIAPFVTPPDPFAAPPGIPTAPVAPTSPRPPSTGVPL